MPKMKLITKARRDEKHERKTIYYFVVFRRRRTLNIQYSIEIIQSFVGVIECKL